ncbi:WSC domain-containing protein 2 [Dinochytrium kinnereticum]|nr:WSC domain-containing protein 2 [Dinochytrium kinnereticum]
MTIERCTQSCSESGFSFAGLEYGQECWCGYKTPTTVFPDTDCYMHCSGQLNQICGAPARLSVYKVPSSAPPRSVNGGWGFAVVMMGVGVVMSSGLV